MTIDTGLSTTSTNPVQNRVITQALGTLAPLSTLNTLSATVSGLTSSVNAETTARTQQYNAMLATLQSYINAQIAQADWMTQQTIKAYADDKIAELISVHNVSSSAHGDIRALIENTVTQATFESHTNGGYNPVTRLNDALHVTLNDRVNWNAAADAVDDHLDAATTSVIHITAQERTKWNGASQAVTDHTSNPVIHVTESEKNVWTAASGGYNSHVADVTLGYTSPHVTYADRVAWDKVVADLASHVADKVLASSLHLHDGERATWNAAKTTLTNHIASTTLHITQADRESWEDMAEDIEDHVSITSGNPHGTTAADVGAYTVAQANTKVATEKAAMLAQAQSTTASIMAGGIKYKGSVETLAELQAITTYAHGDAYIVTDDPSYAYLDIDGTTKYQACVYVCQVSAGVATWVSFSEPFKVNLNSFDTKTSANSRISAAISTHNTDATAHSTVINTVKASLEEDMEELEDSIDALSASAAPLSTFNAHANNTSNPHAVTAAQVGTLTEDEIETLIDSAEASAKTYAENKIGSIAASTFKWRGSFTFPTVGSGLPDPLVARSKNKVGGSYTAWRRGTAVSDSDSPAYGDCYTETGSGRMFVFTGIPVATDLDTAALPTGPNDRDGYARFGWDDVGNILDTATIISTAITQARALITAHNTDENAHSSIRNSVAAYNSPITVGTETFDNVIDALETLISRYQAISTVRQTASLVELVNQLYNQYSTKQNKLTEGMGIKLTNYDSGGNAVTAGSATPVATTKIEWDPSDMIGTGLSFTNNVLSCTYATKAVTTTDMNGNSTTTHYVVLGEAYATLDWVSNYVSGLMTQSAVEAALAEKQDKLTAGTGIAIFSVMDTSHNDVKKDETGAVVYKRVQSTDTNGDPVYDIDGNPVYTYVQKRDASGNLMFDANLNPIYEEEEDDTVVIADTTHLEISTVAEDEQVLELTKLQLQDHVTGRWYTIGIDDDGDLTSTETL